MNSDEDDEEELSEEILKKFENKFEKIEPYCNLCTWGPVFRELDFSRDYFEERKERYKNEYEIYHACCVNYECDDPQGGIYLYFKKGLE